MVIIIGFVILLFVLVAATPLLVACADAAQIGILTD